jgi:diadenosine tetraphosphatase ApaH/serine/threonine PP2A family protein phosphatase
LKRARADAVVVGGDVCAGPFPREVFERLLGARSRRSFVRGNGDRGAARAGGRRRGVGACSLAAQRLTQEQRAFLGGLPTTLVSRRGRPGPDALLPRITRSDDEIVTRATPKKRLRAILSAVHEAVVVLAYTHVQFDRAAAGRRLINAGRAGLPYEGRPGAYWALLGADVELRHTEYDVGRAAEEIRRAGMPRADEVAEMLLPPPTPEEDRRLRAAGGRRRIARARAPPRRHDARARGRRAWRAAGGSARDDPGERRP